MNRQTIHISIRYLSSLPAGQEAYSVDELESGDFPDFLIRRLKMELQQRSDRAVSMPKNSWADMGSPPVQQAWNHFLAAVHETLYLPANKARPVVKEVISEILQILVQPRKAIPDILFTDNKVLDRSALSRRLRLLVVYEHFGRVLDAYMQRKNKRELERERCRDIIIQVDKKMTEGYTPQQWAQMLDPLFTLAGPAVDTDLFRQFFEDRQMHRAARRFGGMNDTLTREEFISELSSPALMNDKEDEEDQSELVDEDDKPKTSSADASPQDFSPDNYITTSDENKAKPEMKREASYADKAEKTRAEEPPKTKIPAEVEKSASLNDRFLKMGEEQSRGKPPEAETRGPQKEPRAVDLPVDPERPTNAGRQYRIEKEEEPSSLNDAYAGKEEERKRPEPVVPNPPREKPQKAPEQSAPIWRQFMDFPEGSKQASDESIPRREGSIEPNNTKNKLESQLENSQSYFINELFGGSQQAYRRSLREIARKESWREVSLLIRQDIFERNDINIYSQAAVDFTDRLQNYFLNKQNHAK